MKELHDYPQLMTLEEAADFFRVTTITVRGAKRGTRESGIKRNTKP